MAHVDRVRQLLELQGDHPVESALLEGDVEVSGARPPEDDPASWTDGSLSLRYEGEAMKGASVKREVSEDALAAGFFDALIGNQDRHAGQFRFDEGTGALGLLDHGFSFPVERALCRGAYFQTFRRQERPRITDHERELLTSLLGDPELFGSPTRSNPIAPIARGGALSACSTLASSCSRESYRGVGDRGSNTPLGYCTLVDPTQRERKDVMVELNFSAPRRQDGELEWDRIAVLRVDGVEIEGDPDFAEVRDIEVLDVESGQTATFDADPERWARNLPNAFRSGDLVCEVIDDAASDASTRTRLAARA